MQIRTDSQAASHHSQRIAQSGNIANMAFRTVTGGNTIGVTNANTLGSRIQGVFQRYKGVLDSSAGSITVLSNNMISFDQVASRQLRGRN